MKRLAALFAAACGLAVGLGSAAIRAFAAAVTLTPEQAVALFGEQLPVQYWNGTEYVTNVMNYMGSGTIYANNNAYFREPYWYDNTGDTVIVYGFQGQGLVNDANTAFTISLNPVIDIQNINELRFSCGFSQGTTYPSASDTWMSGTNYDKSLFTFLSDYNSDTETVYTYNFAAISTGSGAIYPMRSFVEFDDWQTDPYFSTYPNLRYIGFTTFQCNLTNAGKKWSWYMNSDAGASGITQSGEVRYAVPGSTGAASTPYNQYLFFISCPYISDDYVVPGTGERPEYEDAFIEVNDNLSDILTALDSIYVEQQRNRTVLTNAAADLNLISQYVYGISQDTHSIAAAFNESSLPDIGASHAAFDSALDNAASSFDSMASQDIPQSIENASTGVMGFVWSFIQSFHLDVVFGIVTMLFIVHFVIFRRG